MQAIKTLALAAVVGAVGYFLGSGCGAGSAGHSSDTSIDRDTTIKLVLGDFAWPEPGPDTVYQTNIVTQHDTINGTDTAYIMLDYTRYRAYNRVFSDSNVSIKASLGIQNNALDTLSLSYELKQTTITETRTITNTPDLAIIAGANTNFQSIMPLVGVRYQKNVFSVGYNGRFQAGYRRVLFRD